MDTSNNRKEDVSPATAVLLGALAPGVNAPTWFVLKMSFLTLGISFAVILGLAFTSSDITMIIHVTLLVLITGTLFFLLSSFLAETGLVSVEQQMQDIGLAPKDEVEPKKKM
ncbi:hypothetical protein C5167_009030 [Papaver somniferum]|uniref:Transmembrane protein n=1 Tax=Papaver somniferum TaxID=3469 RepID=A0A4Y7JXP5_PAPSO|nr:uncharacterized protein LOC113287600 [Papaver somniferum]KAI3957651.1 hypothetical protein MKW92_001260 [Papaver armeniacum]RZC65346.1 hypothetical protein C5167_009030 [Papaver somniferum]